MIALSPANHNDYLRTEARKEGEKTCEYRPTSLEVTGGVAQWLERRNSNPRRPWVRSPESGSVPLSQLLCRLLSLPVRKVHVPQSLWRGSQSRVLHRTTLYCYRYRYRMSPCSLHHLNDYRLSVIDYMSPILVM